MKTSIVQDVLNAIQQGKLIFPGEKVVVGVSGGGDSLALLHILYELRLELGCDLIVAHLDHQLRPGESEKDLDFVNQEAEKLGLPFFAATENVRELARSKDLSLEDAARRCRYDFFTDVAKKIGAAKIAVGHTQDDQAETFFLHLLRGSGMKGLEGMKPSRPYKGWDIIRPLLYVSREDLRDYLHQKKIVWREDASNEDLSMTRNRVRKLLIPFLEKEFNPEISGAINRLSLIFAAEDDYLSQESKKIFEKCVKQDGEALCAEVSLFKTLPLALQRRLIRDMFSHLNPDHTLLYRHVEDVLDLVHGSQSGRAIDLPQGAQVWLEFDELHMGHLWEGVAFQSQILQIPGELVITGRQLEFRIYARKCLKGELQSGSYSRKEFYHLFDAVGKNGSVEICEYFDADKMGETVLVRSRQMGDTYDPIGLGGVKKLKEIFINEKVPLRYRDQIPLFISGEKIFWVAFYRISETFKVTEKTQNVLEITLKVVPPPAVLPKADPTLSDRSEGLTEGGGMGGGTND